MTAILCQGPCSPIRMCTAPLRVIASVCGLLLAPLAGCAPSVILAPPAEWPAQWHGRRLYNTPRALIYASSDAAAGEADRLTNDIANQHDLPAPNEPANAKGLIVVTDRGDAPIFDDFQQLLTLFIHGQAQIAGVDAPNEQRVAQIRDQFKGDRADLEPILHHMLVMIPVPVADPDVTKTLAFPDDAAPAVAWAGILPTDAQIRDESSGLTDAILNMASKREELPASALWLVKPMMPLIQGMVAKEVLKQRDAAFGDIVRQHDPEWIADRNARKDAINAWKVVSAPNRPRRAYDDAYAKVRAAADRLPDDAEVLRVLAAAEVRTARYEPAIKTLDRVRSLDRQRVKASEASSLGEIARQVMPGAGAAVDNAVEQAAAGRPSDLAFRAIAAHKLGRSKEADEAFDQLQKRVNTAYKNAPAARAFLVEAAAVLGKRLPPTTQPTRGPSAGPLHPAPKPD